MCFGFWFDCTKEGVCGVGGKKDTWSLFGFNLKKNFHKTIYYGNLGQVYRYMTFEGIGFQRINIGTSCIFTQVIKEWSITTKNFFFQMPKASRLTSCFQRSIGVSDSISLLLETSLFYQGSSIIDLFFLSPTLYSSALLRFVLIYLNYPRIKY